MRVMQRLKLFILIFCIAVSIPMGYMIWRTYAGLAQEERSQLRFFAETLFDRMENELAELVQREENRAVDEYHYTWTGANDGMEAGGTQQSPLAAVPQEPYILGYLQNNPDGSFQTPLAADLERVPAGQRDLIAQLKEINYVFNRKKFSITKMTPPVPPSKAKTLAKKREAESFADRFLSSSQRETPKAYLGRKQSRVEEITAQQAANLAQKDKAVLEKEPQRRQLYSSAGRQAPAAAEMAAPSVEQSATRADAAPGPAELKENKQLAEQRFQVEVAPLQSVFINDDRVFIFRRVAINNQIFRQGFVLKVRSFLQHLAQAHFASQPMAQFTGLHLKVMEHGRKSDTVQAGISTQTSYFEAQRTFPAPFDFISAALLADALPASPARRTLHVVMAVLIASMLLGLLAIYHSARAVVDLSERRAGFVSSVTHELKTPLTNIRMYIEMLEQGIAATPEREQDYLQILGSESARLSRLINNVLELAKLEKKQRRFQLQEGQLADVLEEVSTVMAHKLSQEGYVLDIHAPHVPVFAYDREVLIQVLINLIENSLKFGRQALEKQITIAVDSQDGWVRIAISDKGPGIPQHALKKIFDDFYRVDNDLTRTTGGTGIGLALVKKFITALGGSVQAVNNTGAGCTITLSLPVTGAKP